MNKLERLRKTLETVRNQRDFVSQHAHLQYRDVILCKQEVRLQNQIADLEYERENNAHHSR